MFSVVKVREGLAADDYKDPGWYKHPPGTVACEWKGPSPGQHARRGARRPTAQARRDAQRREAATATHKH